MSLFRKNTLRAAVCWQHTTNETFLAALNSRSHRRQKAWLGDSKNPAIEKNGRIFFKHPSLAATLCVGDHVSAAQKSSELLYAIRQTARAGCPFVKKTGLIYLLEAASLKFRIYRGE